MKPCLVAGCPGEATITGRVGFEVRPPHPSGRSLRFMPLVIDLCQSHAHALGPGSQLYPSSLEWWELAPDGP
jgi:hypothetical protein